MEKIFKAMLTSLQQILKAINTSREVIFPRHQYIPPNAESVDIRQLCDMSANVVDGKVQQEVFYTLKAKTNEEFIITHYTLYTDAELAEEIEFFFDVQGNRQLRFHGTPNDPKNPTAYKLNMGLGPDMKNDTLIECYIVIKPQQTLTVKVINRNQDQARPMGVRIKGYLNSIDAKKSLANR